MKLIYLMVSALVIAMLVAGTAAFSFPNLFSMPLVNNLRPGTTFVPPQVAAEDTSGPFTLSVSGNVYLDKIPVSGAEVSIYLNGRYMGKTTAGDLYMFKVPGVKTGDIIRVDASYQGYKGSVSEVVKFKSMYMDVYIKTDRSFIRTALEMLPTSEDLQQSGQQSTTAPAGNADSSSTTTAQALQDMSKLLGSALGKSGS
ncbi:hypothetical protein [Methanocella arvoryzae]|uniref:Uncharacterized protein n=1 Tax=Methanocella arvoryzae (strain DSM 22066 / NBRC 105507 / MRE50) TaxID=351160 RepID=Q0W084_METAR|nr:hypothetical protein [Methanocella arvoryzae]CAJ38209.1 hypothetical protein RRC521 [Methanocella arvoryzae MRE50]